MCGIFALLNNEGSLSSSFVEEQFLKGSARGPEFSTLSTVLKGVEFGFHRLAINGLNPESNQPIKIGDVVLICNGEIYNYRELYEMMDSSSITRVSGSDCEVIIHLYLKYGIEHTLQLLDGVFAFALLDYRLEHETSSKLFLARDPYGVRPLYWLNPKTEGGHSLPNNNIFGFASEVKVLVDLQKELNKTENQDPKSDYYTINQFQPGTYQQYEMTYKVNAAWSLKTQQTYHQIGFHTNMYTSDVDFSKVLDNIRYHLFCAVEKRCVATERPIACLLSGGLDSSLITALVNEYHMEFDLPLETYSIGLAGSEDLRNARIVADYLGTKHTEIVLEEQDFLDAIPEVVRGIESFDTTTVRASIGNWLLGKYIRANSEAKVIFNGDGSDELMGGYLYMSQAPDAIEFDKECRRLLSNIYAFDVLRSDKSISSHGLEPRTPFLDRTWVNFYMSLPAELRFGKRKNNVDDSGDSYSSKSSTPELPDDFGSIEKYLVRRAFSSENWLNRRGQPILPSEILWRRKEAFSDGVTGLNRSLYQIIQEHCSTFTVINEDSADQHLPPDTAEKRYYRSLFEAAYPGLGHLVPYFWMPKYVEAKDASARTLDLYNKINV
jgi:asparagine synthase (glutamine-hydrolysing)